MPASLTLLEVAAEGGSPAVAKIPQRFSLLAREHVIPAGQKVALVSADHIGQFQPRMCHHSIAMRGSDSSDSRGLVVARRVTSASCR
jgi:hypothetical protein